MGFDTIFTAETPEFLQTCAQTPPMQRLKGVGMNCGCEYTRFPCFCGLAPYSRYAHSLGVARLVWHFTRDPAQAIAGLLHDVATPVFAHSIDFMRGDYLKQEATEDGTRAIIEQDPALQEALRTCGLTTDDVCDYHRYPIADNDSPRLSADRLEYTLGNGVNFGFWSRKTAADCCRDLTVAGSESGEPELAFRTEAVAERFALTALACGQIYTCDEDRYSMQRISELMREALRTGVLTERDLYTTEPQVIGKLEADAHTRALWREFRALHRLQTAAQPEGEGAWRQVFAKKRYIDPLVAGQGRVSTLSPTFRSQSTAYLKQPQDIWFCGTD